MTYPDGNGPTDAGPTSPEGTETAGQPAHPAGIDPDRVGAWLAGQGLGLAAPLRFEQVAGGRSNLTYVVTDATGRRCVLRRPPTGTLLPTAHDMGREHRIISALAPAGVPVPRALGYCEDPGVTGAPFYVMSFVEGRVLRGEGDSASYPLPTRRRICSELVDTLAHLHSLDPDAVGLGDLARRDGYLARQLKRWYGQFQASQQQGGPAVADVDVVYERLVERQPEQGPAGIVHGDYRLDNTVIAGDGSLAAVLDWELCTLGDVLADVGQLLVYWTDPGETSALMDSATADEGFLTREEVAARYAEVSGRSLADLDYYLAFAAWKLACILEGVYARYAAGAMGRDGFDFHRYPETIRRLAAQAREAAGRLG